MKKTAIFACALTFLTAASPGILTAQTQEQSNEAKLVDTQACEEELAAALAFQQTQTLLPNGGLQTTNRWELTGGLSRGAAIRGPVGSGIGVGWEGKGACAGNGDAVQEFMKNREAK